MSYVIWSHVRYRIDSWKFLVGTAKRAQDGTMKTWRQNVVRFGIDTYEVRPREDHHGVDLISDMLPFHRLLYLDVREAVDYAKTFTERQGVVTLLLQRLEKTDEVSPEGGLGRIVTLANQTNPPGSIDNNNLREPQRATFVSHAASEIKCQRYRDSLFFGKCAHAFRRVAAHVAPDQNKLNIGVIA